MQETERTRRSRRSRRSRRARRSRRSRNNRLQRGIFLSALGVIACALILLFVVGIIQKNGPKPDPVTGLKAKVCYADITLQWDPSKNASGYYIYAGTDDDLQQIAEVAGGDGCSYTIDEYTFGREYRFFVSAFGYNRLTKKRNEGEASETVTAVYDPSEHAQKIPVLAYHKVVPAGELFTSSLLVGEDTLRQQLTYLKDNGYRTLTMDEFRRWHEGKLEVPVKSCVFTFDDGFYGTHYLAEPIFRELDQAGTVFCIGKNTAGVTDAFDPSDEKDHYVRQDVIEKTRQEYPKFEYESHTYDMHNRIDGRKPVNVFTYEQMREDCEKNSQFEFHYLAYPWGAYNKTMKKAVRDSGYRLAFAYGPFKYATRDDDTYAVNRIKINGKISMDEFIGIVSGEDERYDIGVE